MPTSSTSNATSAYDDLLLNPTPAHQQRLGSVVHVPNPGALIEQATTAAITDIALGPEAYELRLDTTDAAFPPARLTLRVGGPAGLRHARATLNQLHRRFGIRWPTLVIRDQPAFPIRGVMLDVSRDRIPTMDEFHRVIDLLASLKFNHLQFYTEHTFAYAGHEDVWRDWSPITPDEARTLHAYCQARGIALAANQNCFGHLASWLRRPAYAHLAETHGDWVFDVWPRSGPFSLCPTDPVSLRFVEGLLDQLLPCFPSGLVNIGCDETYDVGFGRSKDAVAARGRGAVYAEFVAKVSRAALARGHRPMFWADIALSNPDALRHLPPELIALAWGYEPDFDFARACQQLHSVEPTREVWVCPGTSTWRAIFGRTTERDGNLQAAATQGLENGATGFLVCDWGDTGHHQQWPIVAHALAHAAQCAWNPRAASAFNPTAAAMHAVCFGHDSAPGTVNHPALGRWLESIGDIDLPLRESCLELSRPGVPGRLRNQSALFIDLHNHRGTSAAHVGAIDLWHAARDRVARAAATIPPNLDTLLTAELRHTADVALLAADRAIARRAPADPTISAARQDLADRARAILAEHRRLWALRSRLGGLANSCRHYEAVIADLDAPCH